MCLSAAIVSAGLAYGQLTNRLQGRMDAREWFTLQGNVRPAVLSAVDQGPVPASKSMPRMAIRFARTAAQNADLTRLLISQQTRGSALYHSWLTPEQYADRFGITLDDARAIAAWLQSFGFTDVDIAPSRTSVSFSGTAGQVQAAFQTSIHAFVINGELHLANLTDPVLPKALQGLVESIAGLHDFHPKPQLARPAPATDPQFTSSISGNHFLTPDDFATIYDVKPLYAAGIDGTGQKVAVVGQSDIDVNDIRAFRSAAGLPRKDPVVVLTGPDPGTQAAPQTEADLDLEWAGGIARNATIIYVNSTDALESAAYAIEHNLAPVLSISYGACEADFGRAELASFTALAQQANTQGMTILASSGDLGAAGCETPGAKIASHGLAVIAPASIPYVTGVGGTTLNDNGYPFEYWNATNNRAGGSATQYIPEVAWNDTLLTGVLAASGGGASIVFSKPAWQTGDFVPNDGARDVPDVALSASPNHDGYLICSAGSCTNGFRDSSSNLTVVGGTSCSAPAMAAIVALLDHAAAQAQGNINPELYSLASLLPNTFHDVDDGDNYVPCTQGSPDCVWLGTIGSMGYGTTADYDQVTGVGSVDAFKFIAEWDAPTPVPLPAVPGPGTLNVSATTDGNIWTLAWGGAPYLYNSQTQLWTEVSFIQMNRLAVGSSSYVWSIDYSGGVYQWNPASQTFTQIPGTLTNIYVGADGDAWGLYYGFSETGAIFHFDPSSQLWTPVPGELNQMAVGNDGAVWGINSSEQIFRFNPGTGSFEYVPGSLTSISVGPDGGVWGVNFNWNTYHFNSLTQAWEQIPGLMFEIAAGPGSNVWAADPASLPYKYNPRYHAWIPMAGQASAISVAATGAAWGIYDSQIAQLSPATQPAQAWHQIPGQLVQLSAASDGNVWGLNAFGQVYAFDPLRQQWTWIPGNLAQIAVARDGAVWGLDLEGSVYRYDYLTLAWDPVPGRLAQIAVADNGDVWGLDAQGFIYRFDLSIQMWTPVPGSLAQLSLGVDGDAWGLDAQSRVYRFDPQAGVFVLQPGSMAQLSVGSSRNVWAIDAAGSIYRFESSAQNWRSVPGQLSQIRVAFDGAAWGINSQGLIWRYNIATSNWDNIPGALTFLSLGSDAVVWGINSGGSTYYFQ